MTHGYVAHELINKNGSCGKATKSSNISSLRILSFEVYFYCEAWSQNIPMQLIDAVRRCHRPIIPIDAPNSVVNIIGECWLHDCRS